MHKISGPFVRATLTLICLVYADASQADHPGKSHKPHVRPENSLAGVLINSRTRDAIHNEDGIYVEPISSVLKTLGAPGKIIPRNDCESDYLRIKEGVRIEVGTGCIFEKVAGKDVLRGRGAYSVEVWGNHATATVVGTARGLALGDDLAKVKRLYGAYCDCGPYTSGTGTQNTHGLNYAYYARYEWDDGVELDIDVGTNGRVNHIQLLGSVE